MTEPGWDVAALLPQQPPMRLLDRIVAATAAGLEAEVDVGPDTEFATADGVPAWIGVEYLGQAAAAYFTLAAGSAAPQAGMLVACPHYDCTVGWFPPGSTLRVRAWPASAVDAALVKFDGEIRIHGDAGGAGRARRAAADSAGAADPASGEGAAGSGVIARGSLSVYMKPEST